MTTKTPLATQSRYAFLTVAIMAQLLLLAILIPATRSEALSFALSLLGMFVNLMLGMCLYSSLAKNRSLIAGALLYLFVACSLMALERFVFKSFNIQKDISLITNGLSYPLVVPIMQWIMMQKGQPEKHEREAEVREGLRNRNGY